MPTGGEWGGVGEGDPELGGWRPLDPNGPRGDYVSAFGRLPPEPAGDLRAHHSNLSATSAPTPTAVVTPTRARASSSQSGCLKWILVIGIAVLIGAGIYAASDHSPLPSDCGGYSSPTSAGSGC